METIIKQVLKGLVLLLGILFGAVLCYSLVAGFMMQPEDVSPGSKLETPQPVTPEPVRTQASGEFQTASPTNDAGPNADSVGNLTWNGLDLEVVKVNYEAWPVIETFNQFNDPPEQDKTMLLITLRATNVEGQPEQPVAVLYYDFTLVGDQQQIYKSYSEGCGVVPGELNGLITRNGTIEGNLCFQVPQQETDFQLIYEPVGFLTNYVKIPSQAEAENISGQPMPALLEANQISANQLKIDIMAIDDNAWPLVQLHNQNNEPPLPNKTMMMITVRINHMGQAGVPPVRLSYTDFQLVGDQKVAYMTYKEGCGVVPDNLDDIVFPMDIVDGNVCFQVPKDEGAFQLIYDPDDDIPPVYYVLPE